MTLFHVLNPIPESFWDMEGEPGFQHTVVGARAWELQQKKIFEDFLAKARRSLKLAGYREDHVRVVSQRRKVGIARDIIAEAQKGYTALIAGRTGLSKAKDLLFGSIANKLVSRVSGLPICVVGGRPDTERVLVGVDGSEGAMNTVEHVGKLFGGTNPELLLLHVIRGLAVFQPGYEKLVLPEEDRNWLEKARVEFDKAQEEIQRFFQQGIRNLEGYGIDTSRITTRVVTGAKSRAAAIAEEAKKNGYGTIVIGRKGASRVEDFVMGRVSNKILQLAKQAAVWVVS